MDSDTNAISGAEALISYLRKEIEHVSVTAQNPEAHPDEKTFAFHRLAIIVAGLEKVRIELERAR